MKKWDLILSVTDTNNYGLIKLRQNNTNSESIRVQLTRKGTTYDLTALKVFFVTHFNGKDNLKVPIQKAATIIDAKEGIFEFVFDQDCMQRPGRQEAYFEIFDFDKYLDTTQNFTYEIVSSSRQVKADFTPYIETWAAVEDMLDEGTAKVLNDKTEKLELQKASKFEVANELSKKVDSDVIIPVTQDLQRQIDNTQAGFIGEFNSERELIQKYPSGTKGFAKVNEITGTSIKSFSYSYRNGSWLKGSPWNSPDIPKNSISNEKLKERSVTREKTSYLTSVPKNKQDNLFDLSSFDYHQKGYYNHLGVIDESSDYKASPFLKVKSGEKYYFWHKSVKAKIAINLFNSFGQQIYFEAADSIYIKDDCLMTVAVPVEYADVFLITKSPIVPLGAGKFKYLDEHLKINEDNLSVRDTLNNIVKSLASNDLIALDKNLKKYSNDYHDTREIGGFNLTSISIPFELKDEQLKTIVFDCIQTSISGVLNIGISINKNVDNSVYYDNTIMIKQNSLKLDKATYNNLAIDLDTESLESGLYQLCVTFIPDSKVEFPLKFGMISDPSEKDSSIFYHAGFSMFWIGNPENVADKRWSKLSNSYHNDVRFMPKISWYEQSPILPKFKRESEDLNTNMPTYSNFEIPIVQNDEIHVYYDGLINAKNPSNYYYELENMHSFKDQFAKFRDRKAVFNFEKGNPISNNYQLAIKDDFDNKLGEFNLDVKLHQVKNPSTLKNVLIIGDSLTAGTKGTSGQTSMSFNKKLQDNNVTNVSLIGTLVAQDGTSKHEGRGGWTTSNYLDPSKEGNPFAFDGSISFKKYCEKNNFSGIDYCFVHLNWNSYTYQTNQIMAQNMEKLISKITNDYPQAHIFIVGLTNYSKNLVNEWGSSTKLQAWNLDQEYEKVASKNENWHVCHMMPFIDIDFGNQIIQIKTNQSSSETEKSMGDFVHMGDSEYKQIADVYYRYLMSAL